MTSNSRGELLGKRRVLFSVEGVGGGVWVTYNFHIKIKLKVYKQKYFSLS